MTNVKTLFFPRVHFLPLPYTDKVVLLSPRFLGVPVFLSGERSLVSRPFHRETLGWQLLWRKKAAISVKLSPHSAHK